MILNEICPMDSIDPNSLKSKYKVLQPYPSNMGDIDNKLIQFQMCSSVLLQYKQTKKKCDFYYINTTNM